LLLLSKKSDDYRRVARAAINRLPVFFLDSRENFPHSPVSYLLRRLQKTKMIKIKRRESWSMNQQKIEKEVRFLKIYAGVITIL